MTITRHPDGPSGRLANDRATAGSLPNMQYDAPALLRLPQEQDALDVRR